MNPNELPLRDLHLPEPIGWLPLAPVWWLLIVLGVAGVGWLLLRAWRARQYSAPRRFAIRELPHSRRAIYRIVMSSSWVGRSRNYCVAACSLMPRAMKLPA